MNAAAHIQPFFLRLDKGLRFCILHRPRHTNGRVMLHVAPFAEEMNRSRRMSALTSRALARDGWTVLQMDLYGCGDSEGDFEAADWPTWRADVVQAAQWLRSGHGNALTLWGVRAGCLLTCDAAASLDNAPTLLMWQPVVSGARHLQQLRRIEAAADALRGSSTSRPDARIDHRQATIEVAGYRLSPSLAAGLASATLRPPPRPASLGLIHIGAPDEFNEAQHAGWRDAGWRVKTARIPGQPFWRTQGTAEVPGLVDATVAMAGGLIS